MDELTARRAVLAQAIETADTEGKLLSDVERDQLDRQARQDVRSSTEKGGPAEEGEPISPERFIDARARRVLAAVGGRNPALAAMQEPGSWQQWVAVGTPLAALVFGVLTDVIANPHRVDLVSLPLLGIVAWNLAMYIVLVASVFVAGHGGRSSFLAGFGRWTDGERALRRRPGNLRSQVTAIFHMRWFELTQSLHVQRCKRVLHLSAAGWAVGVALSLLTRGLVVEYRVGWESTFLNAGQVHAILSVLRLPALLLFPFQPFSIDEVAALQFSQGGGAIAGARWVYMYVALLVVVVIVPRLVLAAVAYVQERSLSRQVPLDMGDPYYARLVSLLSSARVELGLVVHRAEDREKLLRVLAQDPAGGRTLISSAHDDVLRLTDLSDLPVPATTAALGASTSWADRLFGRFRQGQSHHSLQDRVRDECDVVLHVCRNEADVQSAEALLHWMGKPVLVLVNDVEPPRVSPRAEVLAFDSFGRCWIQERTLLDAIGRWIPQPKAAGFARIAAAWAERNQARFSRSMAAVAEHLLFAARQVEEVRSSALTVKNFMPTERQAQAHARQGAIDAVVKRLDESAVQMYARLCQLHGVEQAAAGELQERMEAKFVVQQAVDTPQAGMAGAATGAAMGASVDLLVGGLTLGAATALGALVGGSAGFIAAAWKNRATAAGTTVVQLSDEMMQAMVEAALLRYLAVAHFGRGPAGEGGELRPFWKGEVVAAVEAHKALLVPFWTAARTRPDAGRLAMALAPELETLARKVLAALYPR